MHYQPYLELDALYLNDPSLLEKPRRAPSPPDEIVVIAKTAFLLQGAASSVQEIPLATGIDSRDWVSAVLHVTLDEGFQLSPGGRVDVVVENVFLTPVEPKTVFTDPNELAEVRMYPTDVAPQLYVDTIDVPMGPMLRVVMRVRNDLSDDPQRFTLSVGLIGRKA